MNIKIILKVLHNKKIKYNLLSNENNNKKVKTKKIIKEKKSKNDKNIINTQYYPSKSIDLKEKEKENKNNKEIKTKQNGKGKNTDIKNIYTNPNYNKTPIIKKAKGKIK